MPRRRTNDSLDTSDHPVLISDSARLEDRVAEFQRRLAYVRDSFLVMRSLENKVEFNWSLRRLKRATGANLSRRTKLRRLHPLLELAVNQRAYEHARKPMGNAKVVPTSIDIDAGVRGVVSSLRSRWGRSENMVLRHHVEGLMALIQQMSGKPVWAQRYTKDEQYQPHFPKGVSSIIPQFFQEFDPTISTNTLANIVRQARHKYAGKRMEFRSYFPLYGGQFDPQAGVPIAGPGHSVNRFEASMPTFCP